MPLAPSRAAFASLIGDSPRLKPGDTLGARLYLQRVQYAIDLGGWTRGEQQRLYRIRNRWHRRAYGLDPRFAIVGTRAGRLLDDDQERVEQLRQRLPPSRTR